jgi:hypothetical protein
VLSQLSEEGGCGVIEAGDVGVDVGSGPYGIDVTFPIHVTFLEHTHIFINKLT